MSEKRKVVYRCGDCGKEWNKDEKSCSNCGSTRKCAPVFAEGKISVRSGLLLETHNLLSGKIDRKVFSRSKLSGETHMEAREYRDIDIAHNKYFEHVEELDENGNWQEMWHRDETLESHNERKKVTQTAQTAKKSEKKL